jgi:drug/metabolite transporter (DMT)-like permease
MLTYQWLGVAITMVGAGFMTFQSGAVVWLMLLMLLTSNFFLALSTLVAKQNVMAVQPLILSTARTVIMSLMLGLIGLVLGQLSWPSLTAWLWIIGGSFFGPFLSYFLFYQGLLHFDLARSAVIRGATQPLFVAVYSLILFGTLITFRQFTGGFLMIIGVILMLWKRW